MLPSNPVGEGHDRTRKGTGQLCHTHKAESHGRGDRSIRVAEPPLRCMLALSLSDSILHH